MNNKIKFYQKNNLEIIIGQGMHPFPYHMHDSFMIGGLLEGNAFFKIGNQTKMMNAGGTYVVPSHTGISITPNDNIKYYTICLKGKLKNNFTSRMIRENFLNIDAFELFGLCQKRIQKEIGEDMYVENLEKFFQGYFILEHCNDCPDIINEIITYLEVNADRKFSLQEVSEHFFVSKYHLSRMFSHYTGCTLKQYHNMFRMKNLRENVMKQSQINTTYHMNFASQSHMNTVFHSFMGITVDEYKKSIIK